MPAGLKRIYGRNHFHFLTFSCYRQLPLLKSTRSRDIFVLELSRVRREVGFKLLGYVRVPEHVHLLMGETPSATPSIVLHRLKLRVAKRLRRRKRRLQPRQIMLPLEPLREQPRSFWQARFHDFNVYSEARIKEKLSYMHANPVKRGLVNHPREWAWSSWSSY